MQIRHCNVTVADAEDKVFTMGPKKSFFTIYSPVAPESNNTFRKE
jgi:hypothetical protein